ncbi:MAG: DegT/DnrJ/EryC1/StrS family aminotransferase [Candidatus Hydrogenedentes bacterium]|nr:DegT/DnrJ/EryC1/StrS family aminotransferase [Candidatus Hydrogenedentota bacterium]
MPSLARYSEKLEGVWRRRWLTNEGELHRELEGRLRERLGLEYVSLFCNGTIALMVALQALRTHGGEVITTPFTFPATAHVLFWNGIRPVFCDIDAETFNLDPRQIEPLISAETQAILPVHVYGTPCDVDAIQAIADRHGLRVLYDAAHAFGVEYHGRSLLSYGDASVLSFHATKLFTTVEGGALVSKTPEQFRRVNFLKNFGIADEDTVIGPGINGKLNELQAAFGLLQLETVDVEIANRQRLTDLYREQLTDVPGIIIRGDRPGVSHNYGYLPILVEPEKFGMCRDELCDSLREFNIFARKYFHPLCSHFPCYSALPSADPKRLPTAERVAGQVLCLPIYGELDRETVLAICETIRQLGRLGRTDSGGGR